MRYLIALAPFALVAASAPSVAVSGAVTNGTVATATITTPTNDNLIEVHSAVAMPMLHCTNRKGMVRDSIVFKANKPRTLSKYGCHIMLMSKPRGTYLPIVLTFAKAGQMNVTFKVVG